MTAAALEPFLALHRAGRFTEAEAGYRDCLDKGIAETRFPLAALLLQTQRYAEAAGLLEPLADSQPDDAAVAVNLSIALRHCGRKDEALAAARKAVALAPTDITACNAYGLAALDLGQADEALQAFEAGLRLSPGQIALELHRAKSLHHLGRTREAVDAFQRVVARVPGSVEAWRGLSSAQTSLGQNEHALESSRRAFSLRPEDPELRLEQAASLLRAGYAEAAERQLDGLLKTHPDDSRIWHWLGFVRLRRKSHDGARAAFQRTLELAPDDATAAHHLASLDGTLPERIEAGYVRGLFDDFADRFESTLVDRLAYAVPGQLGRLLSADGLPESATVLDLGCGTGLMGAELTGAQRRIDGVDLSPRMLQIARALNLYHDLHEAEALDFLHGATSQWDAIVAADVFVYVAELGPFIDAVRKRLPAGGRFGFSIECSESGRTELPPETGRYRHAPDVVAEQLAASGFGRIQRERFVIRTEWGAPVAGELLLARVPD